jgi:hypothetical protein
LIPNTHDSEEDGLLEKRNLVDQKRHAIRHLLVAPEIQPDDPARLREAKKSGFDTHRGLMPAKIVAGLSGKRTQAPV